MPMPAHVEEDPYLDPRLRVPNPPPPQQHFYDQPPMAPHQPPGPYSSHPPPPMGMQNQMMVAGPSGQNAWKGHVEKAAESKDGRGGYANKEDAEEAIF
ncbi:unnamed protein product [Parascedosporium putredinis]|uniref:Uncharacterized protein n=1 Tax=Parascedosporium putredinis TaxID=1442378 RepID=A0A9P1GVN3_9PEZI|nr:unnamed protein product [Parascedosporium putredinis]CAI7988660.1 unnamed protein product [Parascedosporium putredinis]